MTILAAFLVAAALSGASEAKTFPVSWNSEVSTVLDAFPQSTVLKNASTRVMEAKDIVFDGVVWKLARFKFDRSGHVVALQLVANGNATSAIKAELSNAASPLWNPMGYQITEASQTTSSDSVTLCHDAEETTLTYARPPKKQPLLLTASNDVAPERSNG